MALLHHVGRRQAAEIDPDTFFRCASNLRDLTHDAQHHRLPLHFGSAGPDIAPDPDLLGCARTA